MREIPRLLVAAILAATLTCTVPSGATGADPNIVGGRRASTAQFPSVVYLTNANGFQFCGGTLLAVYKVVTAAHCVAGRRPAALLVVAGRDDKRGGAGVVSRVIRIWTHPDYTDVQSGADVAVLTLDTAVNLPPARLADAGDAGLYRAGTPGTVLGWGRTSETGPPSRYLMAAVVPMVSDAECARAYRRFAPESMVCAGYRAGGVDTCQGDSGGPMLVGGILVGISSWGFGCAQPGNPGVYTRVSRYAAAVRAQL